MKFRNFKYFLTEALKSMFRNRLMSVASMVTVASCTLILSISYFIVSNLDHMLESVERSMYVVVFIHEDATDAQVHALEAQIIAIDNVQSISFTSAEEALEDLSNLLGDERLLDGLEDTDVLLRSFNVEVTDVNARDNVASTIESFDHVYTIIDDQELVSAVQNISRAIRLFSIFIVLMLSGISAVIIINTIKITVSARKNEISIMKYVGATDWFIRWPFLFEGVLIGLIGAIMSLVIGYFIYLQSMQALMNYLDFLTQLFELREIGAVYMVLTPTILFMGIGIGTLGSIVSVRKHLKV